MIVFDLKCRGDHVFEAWFASSVAFADQREAGRIVCPICGDTDIAKAAMAPAVAAKGNRMGDQQTRKAKTVLQQLALAQARALAGSKWVGDAFPARARAMHAGEEEASPIHGVASPTDAKRLVDDGVRLVALPLPVVPPGTSH
ncbi:MAG: DUF1178 family protein [Sphingomonas bacterium]|nr:DUF1178 family protein [Sphingomonas bacterium]